MTLDQLRIEYFEKARGKGTVCKCCDRFGRIQNRSLHVATALTLFRMYHYDTGHPGEWLMVEDYLKDNFKVKRDGDFHKMRFWGLIDKFKGERPDGSKRVGLYRITEMGKQFVRREITIWREVYTYDDQVLGFSDGQNGSPREWVSIDDCLRQKFSYTELMARTAL